MPPIVVTSSNGADAKSAVGNITLTSFAAINRAGTQSVWWFAIGAQQWGLTGNDPGNGGASAQLSIPITTLIFGQARTTSSEIISSVFSMDVADGLTLYIDSSNIQYQGGYAYLIGSK